MGEINSIHVYLDFFVKNITVINTNQYNKDSVNLIIHLLDNGKVFNLNSTKHSLVFKMKKKDNKIIFNTCNLNTDGTASLTLNEQICLYSGIYMIQFMLININTKTVIHTIPAKLNVVESVVNNYTIESSSEFSELNDVLIRAEQIIQVKNDMVDLNNSMSNNEKIRQANENTRISNENTRISNENTRISNENIRTQNFTESIEKANMAATNANEKANDLQRKLDNHHFVLSTDKGVANGVATLSASGKVPYSQLPDASTLLPGVVRISTVLTENSSNTVPTSKCLNTLYNDLLKCNECTITNEDIDNLFS